MAELTIIIPTLNAGVALHRSLPPLADFDALDIVHEVIFADGGSKDETHDIAEAAGARIVIAKRGRGQQLAAGADDASGRWLLFLHADSCLDPHWYEAVTSFMLKPENSRRAGFFRFALDDGRKRAKLLEWLVALRVGLLGLPYGDQGLLISRDFYRQIGGFRPLPLMEDVDIVQRIGRRRLVRLPVKAVTSAERYVNDGYLLRPLRNLCCLALYFLRAPLPLIVRLYG
jgi:rSAM/selenodomain-associated transferase 2